MLRILLTGILGIFLLMGGLACGDGSGSSDEPRNDDVTGNPDVVADPEAELSATENDAADLMQVSLDQLAFQQMLIEMTGPGRMLDGFFTTFAETDKVSQAIELPGLPECVALDIQENEITLDFGAKCVVEGLSMSGTVVLSEAMTSTQDTITLVFDGVAVDGHTLDGTIRSTTKIGSNTFSIDNLQFDEQRISGSITVNRPSLTAIEVSASVNATIDGATLDGAFNWGTQLSNDGLAMTGNIAVAHSELGGGSLALDLMLTTTCPGPESGAILLDWQGDSFEVGFDCETLTYGGMTIGVEFLWSMLQNQA